MSTGPEPAAATGTRHEQPAFGCSDPFTIGIEEELLVVREADHSLDPRAADVRTALGHKADLTRTDLYAALLELASPVCRTPAEAVEDLRDLRAAATATGVHLLGAGIHPAEPFGHVRHIDDERYRRIAHDMRGLVARAPTCALHVHIGMPDAPTAIRVTNGLRDHLPLLQALSANSPFGMEPTAVLRAHEPHCFAPRPDRKYRARSRIGTTTWQAWPQSSRPARCLTIRSCGGTSAPTRGWARWKCEQWTHSQARGPCWRSPHSCRRSRCTKPSNHHADGPPEKR